MVLRVQDEEDRLRGLGFVVAQPGHHFSRFQGPLPWNDHGQWFSPVPMLGPRCYPHAGGSACEAVRLQVLVLGASPPPLSVTAEKSPAHATELPGSQGEAERTSKHDMSNYVLKICCDLIPACAA